MALVAQGTRGPAAFPPPPYWEKYHLSVAGLSGCQMPQHQLNMATVTEPHLVAPEDRCPKPGCAAAWAAFDAAVAAAEGDQPDEPEDPAV